MLIYAQMIIAILLGIVSAISDFKDKKIYNKNIIIAVILSSIVYIILHKQIEVIYIKNFLINFIITIIVSFAFFYFKIWAAGDAKLFIALTFMIPFELYEVSENNYFGSLYLLILIFSIAFIYVFFETIFLFFKDDKKMEKIKLPKITKEMVIKYLITYFMGYFLILLINNILSITLSEFYYNNEELLFIMNILILFFVYRIINKKIQKVSLIVICIIANLIFGIIFGFDNFVIDFKMLLVILLIMIYRNVSEKYNYKIIDVKDLKDRMILSFGSVIAFYGSRVKGLPQKTDETTDSRLSKDEVDSIKRWSKTAKGSDKITIVRHMPFAPFMLLGELVFFIIKVII